MPLYLPLLQPKDTSLGWSNMKAFVNDNLNIVKRMSYVLERVENLWETEKMLFTSLLSQSRNAWTCMDNPQYHYQASLNLTYP